jgi:hypothetical protein
VFTPLNDRAHRGIAGPHKATSVVETRTSMIYQLIDKATIAACKTPEDRHAVLIEEWSRGYDALIEVRSMYWEN